MKNNKKIFSLIAAIIIIMASLVGCSNSKENQQSTGDSTGKNSITTKELSEKLDDNSYVIVDLRNGEAYNGWQLEGEERGGHIKGAVDFPLSWTKDIKDADLKEMLKNKGITPDKTVVLYDTKGDKTAAMVEVLNKLQYEKVVVYTAGLSEWAQDSKLPMDKLARYEKLVYPAWINELIKGEKPATYSGKEYKIFEVSWGEPKDYNSGHIKGAIHLDTNAIEEEPLWNIKSDKALEEMLIANGVTYDTTVILYGADTTAAARAASVMMYAGVEDVRLLNGGYAAWTAAGFEVETTENKPTPVKEFGVKMPAHPEYIVGLEEAKNILADKENGRLVSIRSWKEFTGEISGYDYIKPKGRIAGAVWGHAGSDAYHMEEYRNIDNTMRNYNEIAANWNQGEITKDTRNSFFCGTGWRASETFFDAYLMGWDNISVYDGGWYEWSMDTKNPVETGEVKK